MLKRHLQLCHAVAGADEGLAPCHLIVIFVDGAKNRLESFTIGAMENKEILDDLASALALLMYW